MCQRGSIENSKHLLRFFDLGQDVGLFTVCTPHRETAFKDTVHARRCHTAYTRAWTWTALTASRQGEFNGFNPTRFLRLVVRFVVHIHSTTTRVSIRPGRGALRAGSMDRQFNTGISVPWTTDRTLRGRRGTYST